MKPFDIITISGTPSEITDYLSDELIRQGAKDVIYFRRKTIEKYGIENELQLRKIFFDIEKVAKENCYECWLESKQIGDKIGIPTGEVIAYSGFSDFIDLLRIETGEEECSAFIVLKGFVFPDWIACGQTWDTKKFYEKYSIFIKRCPSNGYKTLVLTTLLGHAYFGINEKGVAVMIQNLRSKDVTIGLPFSLIVYKALVGSSKAQEAIDIIKNSPRMGAHNYVVVDSSGACFSIETTVNYTSTIKVQPNNFLVHTNHSINSKLLHYVFNYSKTSLQRWEYLYEELKNMKGILKNEKVKQLFSDHSVPICRHGSSEHDVATIAAIWIKPNKKSILAIRGYPCSNPYKEYNLEAVT